MKKLIPFLLALLLINSMGICQSFPFLNNYSFKSLNFQCAGFVTAVYPAGNPEYIQNQILYAKTDIGGIYRSSNNGNTWTSISSYSEVDNESNAHLFYSEYIIAGLAVHPINPDHIVIAWGSYPQDALQADYNCLWMTQNGGTNWTKSSFSDPYNNNRGPWFQGDNLMRKVG